MLSSFKELAKTHQKKFSGPMPEHSFVWPAVNLIFQKPFQHSPIQTKAKTILAGKRMSEKTRSNIYIIPQIKRFRDNRAAF